MSNIKADNVTGKGQTENVVVKGQVLGQEEDDNPLRVKSFAGADAQPMGDSQTVALVRVLVTRATGEQIPTDVVEHEIPILQAIHGEEAVEIVDEGDFGDTELSTNASSEMARLRNKYNSKPDDIVGAVMQNGEKLGGFGFKAAKIGAKAEKPAQSSVTIHPRVKKGK